MRETISVIPGPIYRIALKMRTVILRNSRGVRERAFEGSQIALANCTERCP